MGNNIDNTEVDPSSKQIGDILRDEKGRLMPGAANLNPTGRGGFQDHPELRANGSWNKEDTARFKLEKMMQLPEDQLEAITADRTAPLFERKLAKAIIDGQWTVIKEMMQEVYGRKTDIDMNLKAEDGVPIIKGFILPTAPEDFIDKDIREQLPPQQAKDQ